MPTHAPHVITKSRTHVMSRPIISPQQVMFRTKQQLRRHSQVNKYNPIFGLIGTAS